MLKLGLIGYPLAHSLSPVMHKAAMAHLEIEGDYVLLGTPPEKLDKMIKFIQTTGFKGFNVTIPHKVEVMEYLDSIDKLALKVKAVNTVVIEDNKRMIGHNTDVYGFIKSIPKLRRDLLNGKKAAIYGSGGAARAVAAGLAEMGISSIEIFTLETEIDNAIEIHNIITKNYRPVEVLCSIAGEKDDLTDKHIVINATPVGMSGMLEGLTPLSNYALDSIPKDALVYDLVYKPRTTKLMELARKQGFETMNGLDMLVLQGARSFYLWTGIEPSVDEMRLAICEM